LKAQHYTMVDQIIVSFVHIHNVQDVVQWIQEYNENVIFCCKWYLWRNN